MCKLRRNYPFLFLCLSRIMKGLTSPPAADKNKLVFTFSNVKKHDCSWYSLCEDDNSRIEHPFVEVFDQEGYSNGW
jgi:hypothetical protein